MRAIGFQQGQFGDAVVSTVPARAFKQRNPGSTLTLGLNQRYADMAPLFAHSDFDDIHVYEAYDGWPSKRDNDYLVKSGYDHVFDAMPKRPGNSEANWWKWESQAENACSIYGLPYPIDGLQCKLTKWFDVPDYSGYIAFNYIGAFYAGYPNSKSYTPDQAQGIVKLIRKMGYKVIILGDPKEPGLEDAEKRELSYFDSVKTLLGCRAFVGIDSGLTWLASAYSFPTLASYGSEYYGDRVSAIQPVNPNARYLSAPKLSGISLDILEKELHTVLT